MTNYEHLKTLTVEEMSKWLHELCDLNEIVPSEKWLYEMLNNNFEQREMPIRNAMVNGVNELMRCPFCKESAQIKQLPFCPEDIKSKKWVVGCDGKNGSLCPGYIWKCAPFYVTRDQAVEYWNHREPISDKR